MLADQETVQSHASHAGLGNVGRLLRELQAPLKSAELDVLDDANHAEYFTRDERHDLVLADEPGAPGAAAFARVLERWIAHFHGVEARHRAGARDSRRGVDVARRARRRGDRDAERHL